MKLVFSTIKIDNTTAILHPRSRILYTQPKSVNTGRSLQNPLSFGMLERIIQTKECNCGK